MVKVGALPRAEVALASLRARTCSARTHRDLSDTTDYGRVQLIVPGLDAKRANLDVMR